MKTYLAGIIPKIKKYSEKLDNLTMLTNQHWVVVDELRNSKFVYIFRSNYELLISQNGRIDKGKWEYLGNNSLLIESTEGSYLFRHGFFDENVLALKIDGKDEFAFLVNENKYEGDLNSIDKVLDFLERKYLKMVPQRLVESMYSNQRIKNEDERFPINSHIEELKTEKQYRVIDFKDNMYICSINSGITKVSFIEDEIELFSIWVEKLKKRK